LEVVCVNSNENSEKANYATACRAFLNQILLTVKITLWINFFYDGIHKFMPEVQAILPFWFIT